MLMALSMQIKNVMRVSSKMARNTAMGFMSIPVVIGIMASGHVTTNTDMAYLHLQQVATPTLVLGRTTRCMEVARTHGQMAPPRKESIRKTNQLGRMSSHLKTAHLIS